jgi:hypothetical protein
VPCDAGCTSREQILPAGIVGSAMDKMYLRIPLGTASGGMDVQAAKISTVIECLLNGEVGEILVEKYEDFPLRNKESELVFAGVGEAAQLDAGDGRAGRRREIFFRHSRGEKIGEGLVGAEAVLDVSEGLQRGIFLLMVPGWEVMGILKTAEPVRSLKCRLVVGREVLCTVAFP